MEDYLKHAIELVKAQASVRVMSEDEMAEMISSLSSKLKKLDCCEEVEEACPSAEAPVVDPKRSIKEKSIVCLECGKTFKVITKKHLILHGLDAASYRAKWGFKKGTPRQRENIIMLFAFLGEKPFEIDALSPDEVVLQTQTRKVAEKIKDDPYKEIKQPGDLDLLWGEFFALGTYKPARRVVDALTGKSDRGFAEDVLNGKVKVDPKDDEVMRRLFQGLIPISAEWSILTNLRNKLFLAYMSWALKNDLPVESKAAFSNMLRRAKEGTIISPSGATRAANKAKSGGTGADKASSPQTGEANPAGAKELRSWPQGGFCAG